jgi:hypothetical protein|tara:strand:+ start:448 stop:681 length:234 start_codon:yes stop_codon:yes gene_type:complete
MTLIIVATMQLLVHSDSIIEHETLTLPARLLLRYFFQIVEDATLQMIDLIESLPFQLSGGFLAANPTDAEHRHFPAP